MSNADVVITGRLTADPELKYVGNGSALLNFSVASDHRYKKGDEWVAETSYFDVTAWRRLAEDGANALSKGVPVTVQGRLEQQRWKTDDGQNRSKIVVVASSIALSVFKMDAVTYTKGESSQSSAPKRERQTVPADTDPFAGFDEGLDTSLEETF